MKLDQEATEVAGVCSSIELLDQKGEEKADGEIRTRDPLLTRQMQ